MKFPRRDAFRGLLGLMLGLALPLPVRAASKPVPVVPQPVLKKYTFPVEPVEWKYVQTSWREFTRYLRHDCGCEKPITEMQGMIVRRIKNPADDSPFNVRACSLTHEKFGLTPYHLQASPDGVYAWGVCSSCHKMGRYEIVDKPVGVFQYATHKFDGKECGEIKRSTDDPLVDTIHMTWNPPAALLGGTEKEPEVNRARWLHSKMPLNMLRAVIEQEPFVFDERPVHVVIGTVGETDEDRFFRYMV